MCVKRSLHNFRETRVIRGCSRRILAIYIALLSFYVLIQCNTCDQGSLYGTPRLLLPSSWGCIRTYIAYHSIKYIEHIPLVNTFVIRSMPFLQCFLREGPKQTISSKFIQFHHLELFRDESLPLPLLPLRRCARHAYLCPKDYANFSARRSATIHPPDLLSSLVEKIQKYTIATLITLRPDPQQASFFPCIASSCCELAIWICTARRASSNRSCFECIISLEATDSGCPFIGEFLCIISFSSLVYMYIL